MQRTPARSRSWPNAALTLIVLIALMAPAAAGEAAPDPVKLANLVRQDCGSCHGMQLTGGLGPALTKEALADKPIESLQSTIFHGRPGTPMPGWQSMLSADDARWIAERLLAGFPKE